MSIDRLRKIAVALIYATVVLTPFFYLRKGVYPYVLTKALFFQIVTELLIGAWIALMIASKEYRPRRSGLLVALSLFLAALAIVSAFGVDPWRSFWSTQERAGGVVQFLHLAGLALAVSSLIKYIHWRRLLAVSVWASVAVSLIALIQPYIPNLLLVEDVGGRAGATFGNPTFFAGYLDFHLFLAAYFIFLCVKEQAWQSMGAYGAALAVMGAALFGTQTRGDILGVAAGVVALIAIFAFRPPAGGHTIFGRRALYAGILAITLVAAAAFWFTRTSALWQRVPGLSRFSDISLSSEGLQPRLIALRSAWKGFLDRPILGWGWENFNIVFNKYYDPKLLEANYQETRFDKPHNVFAEYLVTGGIILSLAFLALIFFLIRESMGLADRLLGSALSASFVAYLVRSVFVFDTIGPLLMLYLLIGVVSGLRALGSASRADERSAPRGTFSQKSQRRNVHLGIVAACAGIAALAAYFLNYKSLEATYYQYYGYKNFQANHPNQAIARFKQAVNTLTPYAANLKRDYARTVAEAYFYNPDKVPKEEAAQAVRAMEEVAHDHPQDAMFHYNLVGLYNQVSDIDPGYYLDAAEREAKIALELSPDRQEVYFSLAKTRSLRNDFEGAFKLLEYALALSPKVPDAHFYYGLIAFASGRPELGYEEIKQAIALGRTWKNENEPRVVANFFADSNHIHEAIDLYKISLGMHDDPETRFKVGIAYFFNGDRMSAAEYINQALEDFRAAGTDITKSPTYQDFLPILRELGIR